MAHSRPLVPISLESTCLIPTVPIPPSQFPNVRIVDLHSARWTHRYRRRCNARPIRSNLVLRTYREKCSVQQLDRQTSSISRTQQNILDKTREWFDNNRYHYSDKVESQEQQPPALISPRRSKHQHYPFHRRQSVIRLQQAGGNVRISPRSRRRKSKLRVVDAAHVAAASDYGRNFCQSILDEQRRGSEEEFVKVGGARIPTGKRLLPRLKFDTGVEDVNLIKHMHFVNVVDISRGEARDRERFFRRVLFLMDPSYDDSGSRKIPEAFKNQLYASDDDSDWQNCSTESSNFCSGNGKKLSVRKKRNKFKTIQQQRIRQSDNKFSSANERSPFPNEYTEAEDSFHHPQKPREEIQKSKFLTSSNNSSSSLSSSNLSSSSLSSSSSSLESSLTSSSSASSSTNSSRESSLQTGSDPFHNSLYRLGSTSGDEIEIHSNGDSISTESSSRGVVVSLISPIESLKMNVDEYKVFDQKEKKEEIVIQEIIPNEMKKDFIGPISFSEFLIAERRIKSKECVEKKSWNYLKRVIDRTDLTSLQNRESIIDEPIIELSYITINYKLERSIRDEYFDSYLTFLTGTEVCVCFCQNWKKRNLSYYELLKGWSPEDSVVSIRRFFLFLCLEKFILARRSSTRQLCIQKIHTVQRVQKLQDLFKGRIWLNDLLSTESGSSHPTVPRVDENSRQLPSASPNHLSTETQNLDNVINRQSRIDGDTGGKIDEAGTFRMMSRLDRSLELKCAVALHMRHIVYPLVLVFPNEVTLFHFANMLKIVHEEMNVETAYLSL